MATYSITRALVELKRLDSRISSAIASGTFAAVRVGKNASAKVFNSAQTIAQTETEINASFQQVDKLIKNRQVLKAAIVASNAETKVTVLGNEISVAAAIDLKATLPIRKQYLTGVRTQLVKATVQTATLNGSLLEDIQKSTEALLGGQKEMKDTSLAEQLAEKQREQREASVLGQATVEAKVKALEDEILAIETELDFVLSESNALTTISIED